MKKQKSVTTRENLEARFEAGEDVIDYFYTQQAVHPNWGGSRRGAGRKPKGNVRLQVFVPPEVRAKIQHLAHRQGKTLSEIVAARF